MNTLKLSTLAAFCGGVLDGEDILITDICPNTRQITPGCLFTPLIGERADGHKYIDDALTLGAAATLCAHDELHPSCPAIRVENTLRAVQKMAAVYRQTKDIRLVGVTGSVGKTTTGRMIAGVLDRKYKLLKTADDMNGQIGLTYAMFRLDDSHEAAVMEMGMSQYGELRRLTNIAAPDIAVINSIGTAHIEFFGTRAHILEAKLEILEGMKPDGIAVFCGDEPLLWDAKDTVTQKVLTYGIENAEVDVHGEILSADAASQTIHVTGLGRDFTFTLPSGGIHNGCNALAACTVGILMDVSNEDIIAGLASYEGAKGRQRVIRHGTYTLIDDCYNASPDAVKASLKVLASIDAPQHIAVLGGMRELGEYAEKGHTACGIAAAEAVSDLLCYGDGSEYYVSGAVSADMDETKVRRFDTRQDLATYLLTIAKPGAAILFKGSRAMKMEEVLETFMKEVEV